MCSLKVCNRPYIAQSANVQFNNCSFSQSVLFARPIGPLIYALDSQLHIAHSMIAGTHCPLQGIPGVPALQLSRCRVVVHDSSLLGASGGPGCQYPASGCLSPRGTGAHAVVAADQSTIIVLRSMVNGGSEGGCVSPAGCSNVAGGHGALIQNSRAFFEGTAPVGGVGQPPGQPYVVQSGGTVQINPNSTPSVGEIRGEQQVGKTIRFALDAKPNSIGALLMATQPTLVPP